MASIIKNPEGARFYRPDGTVVFSVPAHTGGEREPTIADARKHGWLPSVTEVLKILDKPFLTAWKLQHILEIALKNPIGSETEEQWILRVSELSKEYASLAADRGREIHAAIENCLPTGKTPDDPACARACAEIRSHYGDVEILCEQPFVCNMGYAGTRDMVIPSLRIVADIKTKEAAKFDKPSWEMGLQLGAYSINSPMCVLEQIIVDRDTGETLFFRWGEKWKRTQSQTIDELQNGFLCVLNAWKAKNQL